MRSLRLLFVLPLMVLSPLCAQGLPAVDARLTGAKGSVTVTVRDGKVFGPPVAGIMPLEEGDRIHTGPHATAEIALDGKTVIHLQEASTFRLIRLTPMKILLGLERGTLLAKVGFEKSEGRQISVIGPNGTATVCGTEFVVQQFASLMRVGVLDEGHVRVTKPGFKKAVVLHFNQETFVQTGHAPEDVHTSERFYMYKGEMGQMRQRIKDFRKVWDKLTPPKLHRIRAAWIKTHLSRKHR